MQLGESRQELADFDCWPEEEEEEEEDEATKSVRVKFRRRLAALREARKSRPKMGRRRCGKN